MEIAQQITNPPVTSEDFRKPSPTLEQLEKAPGKLVSNAPTLSRFWKIVAKAGHRGRQPQRVSFVLEFPEPVARKIAKRKAQDALQKKAFRVQGWVEITATASR